MAKTSKQHASTVHEAPGYEGRFEDLGGYCVAFESCTEDADLAPLFAGLPDDRCQCPHWGFVVRGRLTFRYAGGEETVAAGEAYFARPGHTPVLHAGTEVVEFSPTAELERTLDVVLHNAQAARGLRRGGLTETIARRRR
jgi:hypothetical protein